MISRAGVAPAPEVPRSIKARLLRATPWQSPWKVDRVRKNVTVTRWPLWVRNLRGRPGVYLVRDAASREVLYVGRGRDVREALLRHFHAWGPDRDRPHRRVVFDRARVEVKVCFVRVDRDGEPLPGWLAATEADLIARHRPRENVRLERAHRVAITDDRQPGEDEDPLDLWRDPGDIAPDVPF